MLSHRWDSEWYRKRGPGTSVSPRVGGAGKNGNFGVGGCLLCVGFGGVHENGRVEIW